MFIAIAVSRLLLFGFFNLFWVYYRNGILSKTAEHDEAVDEILMNAIETEEEMSHMSVHLSEFLCRQSTKQWPRPEGLSATLWHYGDQVFTHYWFKLHLSF